MLIRLATQDDSRDIDTAVTLAVGGCKDRDAAATAFAVGAAMALGQPVIVAEQEEPRSIVGLAAWVRHPGATTPRTELAEAVAWVTPLHRRKGICREMRELAAKHARESGFTDVYTRMPVTSIEGIEASRKTGFRTVTLEMRRAL